MYLLDPSTPSPGDFIRSSYQSGWHPMYIHLWFLGHLLLYSVGYVVWRLLTDGPFEIYHENGQLREKGTLNMGEKCGVWQEPGWFGRTRTKTYPPCPPFPPA